MNNKGFTLVELLAVLVILAILIGIGVFTVNNIQGNAEKNYYVSMEDTLKVAGNDYFNDNREDRPIDDYNFVSLETLEDHEYLDILKTYDKKVNCDKKSGVYIYNTENGNEYEVCLMCGEYKSSGDYCNEKKTGQIMISGKTDSGDYYNPLLSYSGTPWVNTGRVDITFNLMGDNVSVSKYEIYNGNTNTLVDTCIVDKRNNPNNRTCTKEISVTGSYYAIAYNESEKVANRKYFNVKIDNVAPTFDFKNNETNLSLGDGFEYNYQNEIINIHDDNGYKSVVISLVNLDTNVPIVSNKDITNTNLEIVEKLPSGRYKLSAVVTDYAKNATLHELEFFIKYNVNLVFFDNLEKKHDIGILMVYKGGEYTGLPLVANVNNNEYIVDWYDNSSYTGDKYTSDIKVMKSNSHTLYGREKRIKVPESDYPHCNNNNDFTYNGSEQTLVTPGIGFTLTNNIQKNAGEHTIIAMPNADFTWADGTRTYKIIKCTIKKYPVTIPNNVCKNNLIYNGSSQNLVKQSILDNNKTSFGFTAYNIDPLTGKDAGTYSVGFSLWDKNNYIWSDNTSDVKNFDCIIDKYKTSFNPSKNPCRQGLIYDAKNQYLIDMSPNNGTTGTSLSHWSSWKELEFAASPIYGYDAGDYEVVYSLNSNKNFAWSDGTTADKKYTCTIGRYPATFPKECRVIYSGLTNQGNISMAANFAAFTAESIVMFATPTNISPSNDMAYEAKVEFSDTVYSGSNFRHSNYYIAKSPIECYISPSYITVTAESDKKVYDGKPLKNDKFTTYGAEIYGDKVTEVTVTGSQTIVGTSDNVPSKAVIKNGGKDVSKYYHVVYKNGTLEVYDDVAPTCSLSISESGVITASPKDNYQLDYYGFSSSYSGSNTTSKTISSPGTTTYYVKDTSGNKGSCSISYIQVKQKSIASCKKYNPCENSSCECKTHSSCENNSCPCKTHYSCQHESCGCRIWGEWSSYSYSLVNQSSSSNTKQTECTKSFLVWKCHSRTCSTLRSCVNDNCECMTHYSCVSNVCPCKTYSSCENAVCGCNTWNSFGEWFDDNNCVESESNNDGKKVKCRTIYRKK